MRCFFQIQERWYVLANWKARAASGDVAVFREVDTEDVEMLLALRRQGYDDEAIFVRLYPTPPTTPTVTIPVSLLTKAQLAFVLEHMLRCSLPSLTRMRRSDLLTLWETLGSQPMRRAGL